MLAFHRLSVGNCTQMFWMMTSLVHSDLPVSCISLSGSTWSHVQWSMLNNANNCLFTQLGTLCHTRMQIRSNFIAMLIISFRMELERTFYRGIGSSESTPETNKRRSDSPGRARDGPRRGDVAWQGRAEERAAEGSVASLLTDNITRRRKKTHLIPCRTDNFSLP